MSFRRSAMTDTTKLGPRVRRFLLEHLVGERNLAHNAQRSYRDSLIFLISFIAGKVRKQVDQLTIEHLTAERVRLYPPRLGTDASVRCDDTQPTGGGDSCAGALHRATQPRAHRVVWADQSHPV